MLVGKRVLVVEDNRAGREILQQQLQAWQMQVQCASTTACSAQAALADAARAGSPFDLALLDMHLPRMDGLALAQAMLASPFGRRPRA